MSQQVTIKGITYEVTRSMPHPQIEGRALLILRRPKGNVTYVCTAYENGMHSDVDSFGVMRRMVAA